MSNSRTYRDGNKFIKVYISYPYEYVEQAYLKQKFVYDAGLFIPNVYGIKKISDTEIALEMEYMEGKPLVEMYDGKSEEKLTEAMRIMAKLQWQMNAIDATGLPDLTDFYRHEIISASYLTTELKETILDYMKSLDKGKTNLCHGDIHPYNIMYNGDKYWIIDWEDASKGDPAADTCMQHFYSIRRSAKINKECDEQYLRIFCEESGIAREDILAWLPVIAGVQINLTDDEDPNGEDRAFILEFIEKWYKNL